MFEQEETAQLFEGRLSFVLNTFELSGLTNHNWDIHYTVPYLFI